MDEKMEQRPHPFFYVKLIVKDEYEYWQVYNSRNNEPVSSIFRYLIVAIDECFKKNVEYVDKQLRELTNDNRL